MKFCARCGAVLNRKVMSTARFCSAECRQRAAKEAYKARQRLVGSSPVRFSEVPARVVAEERKPLPGGARKHSQPYNPMAARQDGTHPKVADWLRGRLD